MVAFAELVTVRPGAYLSRERHSIYDATELYVYCGVTYLLTGQCSANKPPRAKKSDLQCEKEDVFRVRAPGVTHLSCLEVSAELLLATDEERERGTVTTVR